MQTTVTENELDFSELDALIQEADSRVSALESQVATLERENEDLLKKIAGASVEDAARYRQQYNANRKRIEELEGELAAWRKQQAYKAAREEAAGDNSVPTDDYYRLPAIMQDCRAAYSLTCVERRRDLERRYVRPQGDHAEHQR